MTPWQWAEHSSTSSPGLPSKVEEQWCKHISLPCLMVYFLISQVTTRLLCSSCPVVYWFAAHLLTETNKPHVGKERPPNLPESQANLTKRYKVALFSECPKSFWGQVILSYFLLYFVMGIVLYSNFLPWTWSLPVLQSWHSILLKISGFSPTPLLSHL